MTYQDIINEALFLAGHTSKGAEFIETEYKRSYDFHLSDLLSLHDWIFSMNIIQLTDDNLLDDSDEENVLNYNYRYKLPDNVKNVVSDSSDSGVQYLSPREAVRAGLRPTTFDGLSRPTQGNFVFVNGTLHTDRKLTEILVTIDVTPEYMTDSFRQALTYLLASIISYNIDRKDERYRDLERKHMSHLARAAYDNTARPLDPQLRAIYDWVRRFRITSY